MSYDFNEVESAVSYALSEQQSDLKRDATNYCSAIIEDPDAWKPMTTLLMQTSRLQTRFFCLTVIETALSRSDWPRESAQEVQNWLYTLRMWCSDNKAAIRSEPPYLRNKLAALFAKSIQRLFPQSWMTAMDDMFELFGDDNDMLLRLLHQIHEEVVRGDITRSRSESKRCTEVKDAMRACGILPRAVELWTSVITSYAAESGSSDKALLALQCLAEYTQWIDIGFVTSDEVLGLLYQCVVCVGGTLDVELSIRGLLVFQAIVKKGMDGPAKLQLLCHLKSQDMLAQINLSKVAEDGEEEFIETLCNYICTCGQALLELSDDSAVMRCGEEAIAAGRQLLSDLWTYALNLVQNVHPEAVSQVMPFVEDVVMCAKVEILLTRDGGDQQSRPPGFHDLALPRGVRSTNNGGKPFNVSFASQVPNILDILVTRYTYPNDVDAFDTTDEAAHLDFLRHSIKKCLGNITRADEHAMLMYIQQKCQGQLSTLQHAPWWEAEVIISMLYVYGEGCKTVMQQVTEGPLHDMLMELHSSNVHTHENIAVVRAYFEVLERYSAICLVHPELFPQFVDKMTGQNGLAHGSRIVSSRVAYLFVRTIRSLIASSKPSTSDNHVPTELRIEPLVEGILDRLAPFLSVPFPLSEEGAKAANGMSADDKGYLFEAAGYLIAQCCPDVETQTSYLRLLLPPLVEQLETGLNEAERRMQVGDDDNLMEVLGVWVVDLLSSIGHITKGFKNVQHAELVTLLMSISGSAMRAVHMAPESTEIRDKVCFYLHRMIEAVGESIVSEMPSLLSQLTNTNTMKHAAQNLRLFNQVVAKFGNKSLQVIELCLVPLLEHSLSCVPSEVAEESDIAKDITTLRRAVFMCIQNTLQFGDVAVVYTQSEAMAEALLRVCELLCDTIATSCDPSFIRPCLLCMHHVVTQFSPFTLPNGVPPAAFGVAFSNARCVHIPLPRAMAERLAQFVYSRVCACVFDCVLCVPFTLRDTAWQKICEDLCRLLCQCAIRYTPQQGAHMAAVENKDFCEHIATAVLPSYSVPQGACESFAQTLQLASGVAGDVSQLFHEFAELINHMREARDLV